MLEPESLASHTFLSKERLHDLPAFLLEHAAGGLQPVIQPWAFRGVRLADTRAPAFGSAAPNTTRATRA